MYEFSALCFHLIDWLGYQRCMDGRDHSVNTDPRIDCDNLDLWHL